MPSLEILASNKQYWIEGEFQCFLNGWMQSTKILDVCYRNPVFSIRGQDFGFDFHDALSYIIEGPDKDWVYLQSHNRIFRIRPHPKYLWIATIPNKRSSQKKAF